MLLVPLLLRVGLLAGLLVAVHHLTTRLSGGVGSFDQPGKGDISSEVPIETSADGILSAAPQLEEDTDPDKVKPPSLTVSLNATSATSEESVTSIRSSDVLVSINGESFVFHYIPDSTTFGDLAAEFCKSQGTLSSACLSMARRLM